MTLRNQKNHYNVKFLKGYGCAVSLKNNEVTLKNGLSPFSDSREIETFYVTMIPYEKIILSGKGYVSTEGVKFLSLQGCMNMVDYSSMSDLLSKSQPLRLLKQGLPDLLLWCQ